MPVSVFISYAHEDRSWCERLLDHLGWLRHSGELAVFDDQQIKPGEQWDDRIRSELAKAQIVVPLVSPSFIGSRYCAMDELLAALQGGKRLVPVLLQHVDLKALPITAIQCLPKDERQDLKPLAAWHNPDQALAAVAAAIREAVTELEGQTTPTAPPMAGRVDVEPRSPQIGGHSLPAAWLIGTITLIMVAVAAIGWLVPGDTNVNANGGIAAGRDATGNTVTHNGTKP